MSGERDSSVQEKNAENCSGVVESCDIQIHEMIKNLRKKNNTKSMPSTVKERIDKKHKRNAQRLLSQDSNQPAGESHRQQQKQQNESGIQRNSLAARNHSLAPQLRFDDDGNIVIDEASLVVTMGVPSGDELALQQMEAVEVGMNHVSSASFSKRQYASPWSQQETELFYDALRKFGTEFGLMESVLKGRTRKMIKNKFIREEKAHPMRVDAALNSRVKLDQSDMMRVQEFAQQQRDNNQ